MMQHIRGKFVTLSAILLFLAYLGYRVYEGKSDAVALQDKTLEDAVPTVAVVSPKPLPATEIRSRRATSSRKSTRRISTPNMRRPRRIWNPSAPNMRLPW